MAEPVVRDAKRSDAAAIGRIHVRGWQAAYRGMMPDGYLAGLDIDERTTVWMQRLDRGHTPPERMMVIEHPADDHVAGFAFAGPCPDADMPAEFGQVFAIYLEPESWGEGLGRVLLEAAAEHLRTCGYSSAVLWVLEQNERARRFYEIAGWEADGAAVVDHDRGFPMHEIRYRTTL